MTGSGYTQEKYVRSTNLFLASYTVTHNSLLLNTFRTTVGVNTLRCARITQRCLIIIAVFDQNRVMRSGSIKIMNKGVGELILPIRV